MKITICGSLQFEDEINYWHEQLSMAGHVVYCMVVMPSQKNGNKDWYNKDQKAMLDLLHLAKIDESDAIFVVDVDNYIGESTGREIQWAKIREKIVYYLSTGDGVWLTGIDGLAHAIQDNLDANNGEKNG